MARLAGWRSRPFDGDRAGAAADIPQQFAAARRQRRQCHRADLALGDLAVVLEQRVGQPGASGMTRASGAGHDFDRHQIQADRYPAAKTRRRWPCGCARAVRPALPAHHAARAEAVRAQHIGDRRGRRRIGGQSQNPRPRLQQRQQRRERAAAERDRRQSCIAQPSRAQASRRRRVRAGTEFSSAGIRAASSVPTPKQNGSPEASTATVRPRAPGWGERRRRVGWARAVVSPWINGSASARWRAPPTTRLACRSARARGRRGPRHRPRQFPDGQPARRVVHGATVERSRSLKLLILGGTTEASALARALAGDARFDAMLSLRRGHTAPRAAPDCRGESAVSAALRGWFPTCKMRISIC